MLERWRFDRRSAGALAVPDQVSRDAVLRELIDQRAGKNRIEELVELGRQRLLRTLPGRPPEQREYFDVRQQGTVTISQLRRGRGRCRSLDGGSLGNFG